jgi:hypothetical protein
MIAIELVRRFRGGDPIAGAQALASLVALGEAGETALFSEAIRLPNVQARRRWLRYVASRPERIAQRLLERVREPESFQDQYAAADLFAGFTPGARDPLRSALTADFANGTPSIVDRFDYWRVAATIAAWGAAGGDADTVWQLVSRDPYAWEKLRVHAFRAACAAAARGGPNHLRALTHFVMHEWTDGGLATIAASPDERLGNDAIDAGELWLQAYQVFALWRNGEVVDHILAAWSEHDHWRVRAFGAQILAAIGFRRAVQPVLDWLRREPVIQVRHLLIGALGHSDTVVGADALLQLAGDRSVATDPSTIERLHGELAVVGWRARDKAATQKLLLEIADDEGIAATEALISLARCGIRASQLDDAIVSPDDTYRRLHAAIAFGYLGDRSMVDDLLRMRAETTDRLELVYLMAALAILDHPGAADDLGALLADATTAAQLDGRMDLYFMKRSLQHAVIAAFSAGGTVAQPVVAAWRAELDPLKVQPRSVVAPPAQGSPSVAPMLDVFISHASEDKDSIARPLRDALIAVGLTVWFDETRLTLGDSLRRSIDDGLAHCRFGVVILSPNFFAKEWPQRELDGLDARELASGRKAILPIWHNIELADVARYSPRLADRVAVRSSRGIAAVVEEIRRALAP